MTPASLWKKIRRVILYVRYIIETVPPDKSTETAPLYKICRLVIPTYDGSGQAVHPDILIQDESPKYILIFTPYPYTDDSYENPSIVVSENGVRFYEERTGLNPLVDAPEIDHNDDPDIFLTGGQYTLLYLETLRPLSQNLCLLQSRDRIIWTKKIIHSDNLQLQHTQFMLSPAAVQNAGKTVLYYVNRDAPGYHRIEFVTGNTIDSLNFHKRQLPVISGLECVPWHIDIISDKTFYYMLISTVDNSSGKNLYSLRVARSTDLATWNISPKVILENCYRSTGFVREGIFHIYFSRNVYLDEWRIALYKARVNDFF
jgi:hypothetical protein